MPRPRELRSDYVHFQTMTTRWRDNDVYGHMNNAVYYEYVDACVNGWLMARGVLDLPHGPTVGLVVETGCVFHESLRYPEPLVTGLRVAHIGRTSVRYEIGFFRDQSEQAAAEAHFNHVYVNAKNHLPVELSEKFRADLAALILA